MQIKKEHPILGEIVYEESFWIGTKAVSLNGVPLTKKDKKTFLFEEGELTVKGSMLTGVKLVTATEESVLVKSPAWYEILFSVLAFGLILVWGNSVRLCEILPLIGGGIGGGIIGAGVVVNLTMMRRAERIGKKLLIGLAVFAATFAICLLIGASFVVMINLFSILA